MQRNKSLANGFTATGGMVRGASAMFFQEEKHERPIHQRKIFWSCLLVFLGYLGGAAAIAYLYFNPPAPTGNFAQAYSTERIPDGFWGNDTEGRPCPPGGCTLQPTMYRAPTFNPTTRAPTSPTILAPTKLPTFAPTQATNAPYSERPTNSPSKSPTRAPTPPTGVPTKLPTKSPTLQPTKLPTLEPTLHPTSVPTLSPTSSLPTYAPTSKPTGEPTASTLAPVGLPP